MDQALQAIAVNMAPWHDMTRDAGRTQVILARDELARRRLEADRDILRRQALADVESQRNAALFMEQLRDDADTQRFNAGQDRMDARAERQDKAVMARRDEDTLNAQVMDTQRRNMARDASIGAASALGYSVNPLLSPEENDRARAEFGANYSIKKKEGEEQKAVAGLARLIKANAENEQELADLYKPHAVTDQELAGALAADPMVASIVAKNKALKAAFDKNPVTALASLRSTAKGKDLETLVGAEALARKQLQDAGNARRSEQAALLSRSLLSKQSVNTAGINDMMRDLPGHRVAEAYEKAGIKSPTTAPGGGGGLGGFKASLMAPGTGVLKMAPPVPMTAIPPQLMAVPNAGQSSSMPAVATSPMPLPAELAPSPFLSTNAMPGAPRMVTPPVLAPLRTNDVIPTPQSSPQEIKNARLMLMRQAANRQISEDEFASALAVLDAMTTPAALTY